MAHNDNVILSTEENKNAYESYIYDIKSKVNS